MKLVYKTFVSVIVSLSLLASTFVGALCVNLKSASAAQEDSIYLSVLQNRVESHFQSQDITSFFERCSVVLNDTWYDADTSRSPFGCFALTDPQDDTKTCIILIRGNWLQNCTWSMQQGGSLYQKRPGANDTYPYAGIITSYLFTNGNTFDVKLNANILVSGDSSFSFNGSNHYFVPCESNFRHTVYNSYLGSNSWGRVYFGLTSDYITPNLFPAPVSAYDNIFFTQGTRYYWTPSDQSIIRTVRSGSGGSVNIGFMSNSDPESTIAYSFSMSDFVSMPIFAYPGVSNISQQGLEAIDVTDIVVAFEYDSLNYSRFVPQSEYPDYFSYVECPITLFPSTDLWSEYYNYVNQFLAAAGSTNQVVVYNPPAYVSSNTYTSYHNISVSGPENQSVGYVVFNEIPDVGFDSILVVSDKIFDTLSINLGVIELHESFLYTFSPYMLNQVDLIVVLPNSSFQDIVDEYEDYSSHFINFQPGAFTIFGETFDNGLFYLGTPVVRDVNLYDREGQAYVTQRYLQKVNNYILSDGVKTLYNGLNAITGNQDNLFASIVSGFGTVYSTIQTAGLDSQNIPWLSKIFNLMFSWNLSDKLDNLLDKLDIIIDNTSTDEAEGGFWIEPLYLFVKLFEPSSDDYTNSISAIISTYEGLPAIPSVTPVAIPSSQIYLPGG